MAGEVEARRSAAELAIDGGILLLAGYLLALTTRYPPMARDFPQLVLILVLILGGLELAKHLWRRWRAGEGGEREEPGDGVERRGYGRPLWMVALMLGFLAALLLFGFTLGTLLFLIGAGWSLGYRRLLPLVLSAVVITGFMYAVFVLVMNSLMPPGLLLHVL